MEGLNHVGAAGGRAILLRVVLAVITVALATPGFVTAQAGASDSVSRVTSANTLRLATVYG